MPVRKIPMNHRSLTGYVASEKNEDMCGFESSLERDLARLLAFDPNVLSFEEQPLEVKFAGPDSKIHTYTPDFLVHYRKDIIPAKLMRPLLCEVKYRKDLFESWKELKPKFKAARAYARQKAWDFRILTEREIRTAYLDNATFLLQYKTLPVNWDHTNLLLQAIYDLRETDPESILLAVFKDPLNRAQLIPTLWHMVANRMIGVDLTQPLTMRSRIWSVTKW
jgi:hypothetical protein